MSVTSASREPVYELIKTQLDKTDLNFYKDKAPQEAVFLYGTYKLRSAFETDINTPQDMTFRLHIDLWDNNTDTTDLEQAAATVMSLFTDAHMKNDNVSVWAEREFMTDLPDPDEYIHRIELTFLLKSRFYEVEK